MQCAEVGLKILGVIQKAIVQVAQRLEVYVIKQTKTVRKRSEERLLIPYGLESQERGHGKTKETARPGFRRLQALDSGEDPQAL